MQERTVVIVNKLGLHARAASKFVNLAKRFESRIEVTNAAKCVDGKSIMSIMLLAASQGTEICLRINGDDELDAMQAITELIADRFGEGE
jgi:phosphocarrier protein HPr